MGWHSTVSVSRDVAIAAIQRKLSAVSDVTLHNRFNEFLYDSGYNCIIVDKSLAEDDSFIEQEYL